MPPPNTTKKCERCNITKPIPLFRRNSKRNICIKCEKIILKNIPILDKQDIRNLCLDIFG